jgi:hypothetical protein
MVKKYDPDEAINRDKEAEEDYKKKRRKGGSRFRLDVGKDGDVLLIDEALIPLTVHEIYHGKNRKSDWEPCPQKDCIACEDPDTKDAIPYLSFGTVINLTGFEDDKGKTVKLFKQLLVLKGDAKVEFLRQREDLIKKYGKEDTLAWTVWNIRRGSDQKSLVTGQYFTFKTKTSKKKAKEKLEKLGASPEDWKAFLEPLDYEALYTPKSNAELGKLIGAAGGPRPGSNDDADDDDEFPPSKEADSEKDIEDQIEW